MSPVALFLITIAAIFLIGVIGEVVFERTGVPDVVWLVLVGIIVGPVTGLVDRARLAVIAPYFGALTLVVVLFDGGTGLRLRELTAAASRAALLAVLGFVLSALFVAPLSMLAARLGLLPATWTWLHGFILGAILGGSSSVVIMPALAQARLAPRLANLLNLESAATDVLCVVVTATCIQLAVGGGAHAGGAAGALAKTLGIGLGIGVAAGLLALLALQALRLSHHAYPLLLGALLLLYVLIDALGGSAALGILAAAVLIGNAPSLGGALGLARTARLARGVERTHDQITFMVKSFFFTFIGAMLGPPWGNVAFGVVLGLVLLVARVPASWGATVGQRLPTPARVLIAAALPRGMAAGVLAMLPSQAGVKGTEMLPVIVFAAVVTTILLFAVGFPIARRRLAAVAPDLVGVAPAAAPASAAAASAPGGGKAPTPSQPAAAALPARDAAKAARDGAPDATPADADEATDAD